MSQRTEVGLEELLEDFYTLFKTVKTSGRSRRGMSRGWNVCLHGSHVYLVKD